MLFYPNYKNNNLKLTNPLSVLKSPAPFLETISRPWKTVLKSDALLRPKLYLMPIVGNFRERAIL